MKKTLLAAIFVVAVLLLLPIFGNKLIEGALDEHIETLKANGIVVSNSQSKSSYLQTKKHYEFLVSDADKLVQLLSTFSSYEPSDYSLASLNGTLVGVDFDYNNIPLSKGLSIDLYPIALPEEVMQEMKEENPDFYQFITAFFEKKGIVYHIDYSLSSGDFSGYVKDIKEEYSIKDGAKVSLSLLNATFSGAGDLSAPKEFMSSIETFTLRVKEEQSDFIFGMYNLKSDATFESQSTYLSNIDLQKFEMLFQGAEGKGAEVNASDIAFGLSSNTSGVKGEFSVRNSLKSLAIKSEQLKVNLSDFTYKVALSGVDKDAFEEMRLLLAQLKKDNSLELQQKFQESSIQLLSHGATLNISDLSLRKIVLNDVQDLDGFSVASKITLKEDASLQDTINNTPLALLGNISIDTKITFSKVMFDAITQNMPMALLAQSYAKDEGKNLVFDIKFIDGALKVNDKPLSL